MAQCRFGTNLDVCLVLFRFTTGVVQVAVRWAIAFLLNRRVAWVMGRFASTWSVRTVQEAVMGFLGATDIARGLWSTCRSGPGWVCVEGKLMLRRL